MTARNPASALARGLMAWLHRQKESARLARLKRWHFEYRREKRGTDTVMSMIDENQDGDVRFISTIVRRDSTGTIFVNGRSFRHQDLLGVELNGTMFECFGWLSWEVSLRFRSAETQSRTSDEGFEIGRDPFEAAVEQIGFPHPGGAIPIPRQRTVPVMSLHHSRDPMADRNVNPGAIAVQIARELGTTVRKYVTTEDGTW